MLERRSGASPRAVARGRRDGRLVPVVELGRNPLRRGRRMERHRLVGQPARRVGSESMEGLQRRLQPRNPARQTRSLRACRRASCSASCSGRTRSWSSGTCGSERRSPRDRYDGPLRANVSVNGQQNSLEGAARNALGKFDGQPCILAYDASVNFVSDTVESALLKFAPSAASIQLADLLTRAQEPVHIVGHSQGTLTLFWGLHLADRRLDDVTVDFFGPATSSMAYAFVLSWSGAKEGPYGYCARDNDPVATFAGGNFTGGLASPVAAAGAAGLLGGVHSVAAVLQASAPTRRTHEASVGASPRGRCVQPGLRVHVHRADQRRRVGVERAQNLRRRSGDLLQASTGSRGSGLPAEWR